MICTWKDCQQQATQRQFDRDGGNWANLCEKHHVKLDADLMSGNEDKGLNAWNAALTKGSHKAKKDEKDE